ncbi:molybdopterin synthase subunit MoaE [Lentibacillus halodurans]|uniref:Molybdopterin synthase catalytic subunit n=1 Tax=Lentibacillus halodurans TaxID=237679 RepID=A0A1I0W2Z5_9BACI|nr:molybdopterin synthase subunit MoaE [Lentibacillus halodurans]
MDKKFWITKEPINPNDCIKKVVRNEAGAVNTFIGTVREYTDGKRTLFLEYQAYVPMAEKKLVQIGKEIEEKWEDADTSIVHRIGRLELTDIAVVIAVSTPHRTDAFEASRYAIERIKELVPIWKKEHWEDGTKWLGDQQEKTSYAANNPLKEGMRDD